jgi:hypothetical protein
MRVSPIGQAAVTSTAPPIPAAPGVSAPKSSQAPLATASSVKGMDADGDRGGSGTCGKVNVLA